MVDGTVADAVVAACVEPLIGVGKGLCVGTIVVAAKGKHEEVVIPSAIRDRIAIMLLPNSIRIVRLQKAQGSTG
jgi:hypothetical protein